ncbi:MAG: hypothetical protein AAGK04_03140 [Planctomycetota bacterium]
MKSTDWMGRACYAAAFAFGPAVAMLAPTLLGGGAPASAVAATAGPDQRDPADLPTLQPLVLDDRALLVHQASLDCVARPIAGNPFARPVATPIAKAPGQPAIDPNTPAESIEPPELRLGTIMRGPSGVFAVIDGRFVGVGAEVADGWTVADIDHALRQIEIVHASGASAAISMQSPMPE